MNPGEFTYICFRDDHYTIGSGPKTVANGTEDLTPAKDIFISFTGPEDAVISQKVRYSETDMDRETTIEHNKTTWGHKVLEPTDPYEEHRKRTLRVILTLG